MNSTSKQPFHHILKQKRESQGIEIAEISEQTKINPKYFIAFEKGDFEVLPQVYTRLFLRSYAIEIGADPVKVLENFEIHTTGKIQPKEEIKITAPEISKDIDNNPKKSIFDEDEPIFKDINQKKIIGVIGAIIVIILIVGKLRQITADTTSGLEQNKSNSEVVSEKMSSKTQKNEMNIPGSYLDGFEKITQKTINLGISPPYKFSIMSKTHSTVKIKTIENGVTTLEKIYELNPANPLERTSDGVLQFELKSTKDVSITLNGNDKLISQFLKPENISDEELAIKVNLEEDGNLTAEYFQLN